MSKILQPIDDERYGYIIQLLEVGLKDRRVAETVGINRMALRLRIVRGGELLEADADVSGDAAQAQCVALFKASRSVHQHAVGALNTLLDLHSSPKTSDSLRMRISQMLLERLAPEVWGTDQVLIDDLNAMSDLLDESDAAITAANARVSELEAHLVAHCAGDCGFGG